MYAHEQTAERNSTDPLAGGLDPNTTALLAASLSSKPSACERACVYGSACVCMNMCAHMHLRWFLRAPILAFSPRRRFQEPVCCGWQRRRNSAALCSDVTVHCSSSHMLCFRVHNETLRRPGVETLSWTCAATCITALQSQFYGKALIYIAHRLSTRSYFWSRLGLERLKFRLSGSNKDSESFSSLHAVRSMDVLFLVY